MLIIGLWAVTNGQTKPPLGDVGLGLVILSALYVFVSCGISFVIGLYCWRAHKIALLWMTIEGLLILGLGYFLFQAFN